MLYTLHRCIYCVHIVLESTMHLILVKSVFIFGLIHFLQLFTNYTWSSVRQQLTWTVHKSANACFAFFMNILLLHTLIMHILIEKQSFIGNTDKKSHEPLIWAVVDKANTANVNVCLCLNWSSLVQTWAVPNSEFYSY